MSSPPQVSSVDLGRWPWLGSARRVMRDRPLIPLLLLLAVLVVTLEIVRPGIVNERWLSSTIRFAIPLAILAASQTLTMITGGIDLSVGMVASMSAYVMATQAPAEGVVAASILALVVATVIGLVNGIGVGIFRVHPLIMTLGMSLVVLGLLTVYQRIVIGSGTRVPDEILWLGARTSFGWIPNSLIVFIPLAAVILLGLRRSGFGRLLYAIGDNEFAARLAGVRVWQVLVVLYVISGVLAGIAGLIYAGLTQTATGTLVEVYVLPSVAAAVIGGTSIYGGRGGYGGSIVGAVILTVLTTLLTVLQMPEAARQILFGAIVLSVAAAYNRIIEE
jgi:ribose transport system permease protein